MNRTISLFLATFLLATMTACAPMVVTGSADVEKSAFGPKKRFAVVSIASLKTIAGEKSLAQLFKSTDEIPGADTQPLIDALKPTIVKALSADNNVKVLPEKQVLRNKAYKALVEDERKVSMLFMSDEINVAKNYKYVSTPEKYAQLAQALKVDGVIGITMAFSVMSSKSGFSINGISFGSKSYSPAATITAVAYDRQGNVIWKDSTLKQAEPGDKKAIFVFDFTDVTSTDFQKLHPKAIEIGGQAVEVLLARLDDTISGKGTSSVQSMK